MPTGAERLISSSDAVQGSTTEKTFCSRMRRAMSCVYCAPKSRMTMDSLSNDWVRLDWGSTDEFLKSDGRCKGPPRNVPSGGLRHLCRPQDVQATSLRPGLERRSKSARPSRQRSAAEDDPARTR